ncbi:MAG: cell division protein FtsQ/DivIB [Gammaproteobacteria bacterium]|nr:cell division protein FtsQ/DivIB [Gammaproteobacteria bacterium]
MAKKKKQGQAKRNSGKSGFVMPLSLRYLSWSLLVSMVGGVFVWGWIALHDPELLPLQDVQVAGDFLWLDTTDIDAVVRPHLGDSFFSVDVDSLKERIEALPWVARVSVRRIWPDSLLIQVQEHHALARWGADGLVSDQGVLFYPQGLLPDNLPVLEGPDGQLKLVLKQYQAMQKIIAGMDRKIVSLVLDKRRAWDLWMDSGVELRLGRKDVYQQLLRFVEVYPQVFSGQRYGRHVVDMRYSNGFSVRWDNRSLQAANGRQQERL